MESLAVKAIKWLGPLALVWGLTYPLTKLISESASPIIITWVRIGIAAIFFLFLSNFKFKIGKKEFINAIFNSVLFMLCLNVGTSISSNPGLAAVMIYTQPLFVVVIEKILGTKISLKALSGVLLGFIGIALSITSVSLDLGVIIALIGGIVWAIGTVYYSRNLSKENVIKLNAFMNLVAFPFTVAFTPLDYYFTFSIYVIGLLILLGILAQAIGFYLWFNAVKDLGSVRASTGSLVVPIAAYILTFAILGIAPTPLEVIGSIITLIGVYITVSYRNI
ncbi:EamA family transporter [Acidianus sulfidivorans JP7]|uniref:Transporter n=1 Tax=Acidianus sulfidivorans JP7 TaxID=619593 RepID=A0A2U9ILN8_9CREN|nr:EamA family transporter [Acidianus sulfidivorans]AWR96920.1 EamA family transporter [Acidianus sulfidivorans JP7]